MAQRIGVTTSGLNTDNKIPQWDGANSSDLKDGKSLVTSVTKLTASDDNIPTEKAVVDRSTADNISYDNSVSLLTATNVNEAIDETVTKIYGYGRFLGSWDASSGLLPTVGSGPASEVQAGDRWRISVAGTITGLKPYGKVEVSDSIVADIDNPTLNTQWTSYQGNVDITLAISGPGVDSKVPSEKAVVDYTSTLITDKTKYRKEAVANFASLPAGVTVGETRRVLDSNKVYSWNGTIWLPDGQTGSLTNNLGNWNALTNTPAITSGVGTLGDRYTVSVAGTTVIDTINSRGIGDYIWFDGSVRQKINNQVGGSSVAVATQGETNTGTDDTKMITPLKLQNKQFATLTTTSKFIDGAINEVNAKFTNIGYVTVGNSAISGVTGQYTTIKGAIDAGASYIRIVGGTAEANTITLTKSVVIYGNISNVNTFTNCGFILNTYSMSLYDMNIVCNWNTSNFLFANINTSTFIIYNSIINTNSLLHGFANPTDVLTIYGSTITLPNVDISGARGNNLHLFNVKVLGGGGSFIIKCGKVDNSVFPNSNQTRAFEYFNNSISAGGRVICGVMNNSTVSNISSLNTTKTLAVNSVIGGELVNGTVEFSNCFITNYPLDTAGLGDVTYITATNCVITNFISHFSGGTILRNTLIGCEIKTAVSYSTNLELQNCTTNGITFTGTSNAIQGGQHTTIAVNGNNNQILGTRKATSITLGAVTGCIIKNNQCDNDITPVVGNIIADNVTY